MSRSSRLVAGCLLIASTTLPAATLQTYVEQQTGSNQRALGYPVPLPIESQTAVAGFRSHASLFARHQALALESAEMEAQVVGNSFAGRPIWAYRIGDADATTLDGEPEPSLLLNGTIHAREWQTPEVATAIMEDLLAGAAEPGLERFLLDNTQLVVVPVFNIDGFLQTQRYPTQVLGGEDPTDSEWPRDGRMRRKNMRGVDELLNTQGDHLFGIDLNRNSAPFRATSNSSSNNPRNLVYHGTGPASEPELQALLAAANYANAFRLRFFADLHSFSRVLFTVNTGNAAHDAFTSNLGFLFSQAESGYSPANSNLPLYAISPNFPGQGIGTTSEYFAYTYQIPTWTLEIEPGGNGSIEYGGLGASHDGFILPESQIARVRTSISKAHRLLSYRMAGPAYVEQVRILDTWTGEPKYLAHWRKQGAGRQLVVERSLALAPGARYRLWLAFNKPMRLRENGQISQIPRSDLYVEPDPRIALAGGERRFDLPATGGRWLDHAGPAGFGYARYRDDAYALEFTVPADWAGNGRLEVQLADLTADLIDSNPATVVDFVQGGWSGYEPTSVTPDAQHQLSIAALPASNIKVAERPSQLQEGDALEVELVRSDAAAAASVRVTLDAGETASGDIELPASVDFAPGELRRTLRIVAREDLAAEPDQRFSVALQATTAQTTISDLSLDLELVDNDESALGRWRVAGPGTAELSGAIAASLRAGVTAANAGTRPTEILLPAAAPIAFETPFAGNALPPVSANLRIDGNGGLWNLVPGGRFIEVLAGGQLQLRDLRLTRLTTESSAGDGGLIRNLGSLSISASTLKDGNARDGGLVYSDGALTIERSLLDGGRASARGAQVFARGSLRISASSLVRAAAGSAAVVVDGDSLLEQVSLAGSAVQPALQRAGGSLRVRGSLLGGSSICAAADTLTSLGYNLAGDASCALAAVGDRQAVTETHVLGADGRVTPGAAAIDLGPPDCAATDQELRPRPQGTGAGRCEIGAIELGTSPRNGLWYDPARNGSGFAIERIGNLLFVVWYTFDTSGAPIAYTAQNLVAGATWEAPLLAFSRAAGQASPRPVGTLRLQFDGDQAAAANFSFDGVGSGALSLQYLQFANGVPRLPVGGAWAAPAFVFQGFSIVPQGNVLVVVTYFYDQAGVLRWALGTASAADVSDVPMLAFRGSCPSCPYVSPTSGLSGSVRLAFKNRDLATVEAAVEVDGLSAWSTAPTRLEAFR